MIRRLRATLAVTLCCLSAVALGQPPQQRERGESGRESGRWSGKVKGLAPGGILHFESETGDQWLVTLAARPQEVSFQALATPAFLRPGMIVQFTAPLDNKGEAQSRITDLKVVSQRTGLQLGLQPAGGVAATGLFTTEEDGKKSKRKGRGDAVPYLVTGTLRSIKDHKLYVLAGGTIKAELSDQCQISLDVSDISLAREGDRIDVEGWRFVQQPNQLYPRRLAILAEKTLGVEEKKRRSITKPQDAESEGNKANEQKADATKPAAEAGDQ